MIDLARMRLMSPEAVRDYLGDGNFGGYYERPDEDMLAIWDVAVAETRALLEGRLAMSGPILIWGAGAIGGTLGAAFIRAGEDVLFVDREADHVAAINERGLQIAGPILQDTVPRQGVRCPQDVERHVRPHLPVREGASHRATRRAALLPHLADRRLRRLGAERAERAGHRRDRRREAHDRLLRQFRRRLPGARASSTIAAAARWSSASSTASETPSASRHLHRLLQEFDRDAVLTGNIWGYLWGKLIYGGAAVRHRAHQRQHRRRPRRPALPARASPRWRRRSARSPRPRASGLEAFDGFDPNAFAPGASPSETTRSFDDMVAHNRRSAKSHSGIWRDLAIRKRKTEVDAQLVPIVEIGRRHGLALPLTARTVAI